jgi:hypothetical protein
MDVICHPSDNVSHGIQAPQNTSYVCVEAHTMICREPCLPIFSAKNEMAMKRCVSGWHGSEIGKFRCSDAWKIV